MSLQTIREMARFHYDCDGLLTLVRLACDPLRSNVPDPGLDYMTRVDQAVWMAKHVIRKARRVGLYDDAQETGARHAA